MLEMKARPGLCLSRERYRNFIFSCLHTLFSFASISIFTVSCVGGNDAELEREDVALDLNTQMVPQLPPPNFLAGIGHFTPLFICLLSRSTSRIPATTRNEQ